MAKEKLSKPRSEEICTNKVTENSILIPFDVFVVLHYLKYNLVDMWITAILWIRVFHINSHRLHISSWHDG